MNWGIIERKEGEDDEEEEAAHFISRKTDTRVDLEMKDLGLRLKGSGRSVLDGVTGYLRAGRLTALMGPSGAGKTTLLRLTTAYAMLVNGGKRVVPTLIDRIQDRKGRTVFRHDDRPCPRCRTGAWTGAEEVPAVFAGILS